MRGIPGTCPGKPPRRRRMDAWVQGFGDRAFSPIEYRASRNFESRCSVKSPTPAASVAEGTRRSRATSFPNGVDLPGTRQTQGGSVPSPRGTRGRSWTRKRAFPATLRPPQATRCCRSANLPSQPARPQPQPRNGGKASDAPSLAQRPNRVASNARTSPLPPAPP